MAGVLKSQEGEHMSDENGSNSVIGSLISILILIAIWPYLLALLGFYIAYLLAVAALEWAAAHLVLVIALVLGLLVIYLIYQSRLIPKGFHRLKIACKAKSLTESIEDPVWLALAKVEQPSRTFIPSSNLYCYWCTCKLGKQSFESKGKYFCKACYEKLKLNQVKGT